MAFSMFDDRDGFIDEADPRVPALRCWNAPKRRQSWMMAAMAMRIVSRTMFRVIALPSPVAPVDRWWLCAARCGCRSVILRSSRYARIANAFMTK